MVSLLMRRLRGTQDPVVVKLVTDPLRINGGLLRPPAGTIGGRVEPEMLEREQEAEDTTMTYRKWSLKKLD